MATWEHPEWEIEIEVSVLMQVHQQAAERDDYVYQIVITITDGDGSGMRGELRTWWENNLDDLELTAREVRTVLGLPPGLDETIREAVAHHKSLGPRPAPVGGEETT